MKQFILILIIFFTFGCNQNQSTGINMDKKEESIPFPMNRSLMLTNKEIKIYSQKALGGDNKAAIKLSIHYSFVESNNIKAIKWMELAAQNGDITSMHNAANMYSTMRPPQYKKALFWAEKYKEFSIEEANKFIQDCLKCLTKQCPIVTACQQEEPISATPLLTSEKQIEMQKQQVLRKNYTSAWTLFHHYTSVNNHKEAEKWLKLAAENGSTAAMQKIACIYYGQNRFKEALYWAEKYKESLEQEANESIQNLKRKMSEE